MENTMGDAHSYAGTHSSNVSEDERKPACYFSEPTGWSIPDSDAADPVYVRESDTSSFVPLPQAEGDNQPAADSRIEEHFVGVRTSDEASAIVKPDDFVLYYRKDNDIKVDVAIPLYLAHRNTRNKVNENSSSVARLSY
ncbi:hypothetical protein KIN20_027842 [Parelaphostrongylus tenuis]|uniref:Uncharacterized protein n=1 Tax=Parelaphostrongylus tenuis TaxID=148309 RepID=A0AAD5R061_PARTN|nr:hypothetical protein KIN20_027842 [Parelaphostrongylus tenuis]